MQNNNKSALMFHAVCPVENHYEMASQIPCASLFVIGECGQLSSLEKPEVVTSILRMGLSQSL